MDTQSDYVLFILCIVLLINVLQELFFRNGLDTTNSPFFKPKNIPLVEHDSRFGFILFALHEMQITYFLSMLLVESDH
jgi:hypothetical protein